MPVVAAARFVVSDIGGHLVTKKSSGDDCSNDQRSRDTDADANAVQSHAHGGNASKRSACEK